MELKLSTKGQIVLAGAVLATLDRRIPQAFLIPVIR